MKTLLLSSTLILTVGCGMFEKLGGGGDAKEETVGAVAELQDAQGSFVGVAFLSPEGGGTRIALRLRGLPAGEYAVHIHEFAAAPGDFESAGGHFNPFRREHGLL